MNCTVASLTMPSLTSDERQRLLADESLRSLLAVFATIVDPRSKQGQRYDLPYLLTCLVAALLCNCDSTLAVGQWCRDQRDLLEQLFGPRRFLCPSDSLYRRLLPCLSAEQLEWAIADWVRATLQAVPDEPIALDGKTIRGAKQDGHSGPHLLSFCTHQSQEILLQMRVGDKTNEIPVAHLLLPCLPVAGRVYTADALHTQLPFVELVWMLGGYVVLVVNLGKLAADIHREFHRVNVMGNVVAVELSIRGTFTGPFETPAGVIQPTGAKLDIPGADFWYVEDGKIKEFNCYVSYNIMLAQLGVSPDFASAVKAQAAER